MIWTKEKSLLYFIFCVPFFTLVYNIYAMRAGCFHALDLGIYEQAIMDLAFTHSWNPEDTVRGITIFSDHFDPILIFAAGIQRLFGPYTWVPLVVEFAFYWSGGLVLLGLLKNKAFPWKVFALMLWFFNEGMSVALRYPVHPTTWSAVILLLLMASFKAERFRFTVILVNLLCLFKEFYPFGILMFAVFCVIDRKPKRALGLFINAFIWLLIDFHYRAIWFGSVIGYGDQFVSNLVHQPFTSIWHAILNFEWKATFTALIPVLFVFPFVIQTEKRKKWMLASLFFFAPILLIQFLFGTMRFQYGAPISAFFVGLIVLSDGEWLTRSQLNGLKWIRGFAFALIIYAAGDVMVKSTTFFLPKEDKCRYDSAKIAEFDHARDLIRSMSEDTKMIVSGGLIPVVVGPNQKLYQLGAFSKLQPSYDVVLLARNNGVDLFPYGTDRMARMIQSCRPFAKTVWMDTPNVFLASGSFSDECLKQYQTQ
jgi:hypothetical protein